jgi:hypothetical protein
LEWVIANQSDIKYFTVQKSADSINWMPAGTSIQAINTPSSGKYSFSDTYNGFDHYRVQITDKADKVSYSTAIKINCGVISNSIQIYPIPTKKLLNIVIQSSQPTPLDMILADMSGRTLSVIKKNIRRGVNYFTLNTENFSSGQYILKTNSPLNLKSQRFIIIR